MYYLAPDNLKWEPMNYSYSDFLIFCFSGDLAGYYENYRWDNWRKEVAALPGDKTFSFFPYLWTKGGKDINKSARKAVPVEEQYRFNIDAQKQLGVNQDGK